jgi:hypothetical protein
LAPKCTERCGPGKKSEEALEKVISRAEREPDESLPNSVQIYDMSSWDIFMLLESFQDGMGSWNPVGVLGKPIVELDEKLVSDLMTWRWLYDIAKRSKEKMDRETKDAE